MKCLKDGKFMRCTGLELVEDRYISCWRCVCGRKRIKQHGPKGGLFSRNAIVLVQRGYEGEERWIKK